MRTLPSVPDDAVCVLNHGDRDSVFLFWFEENLAD